MKYFVITAQNRTFDDCVKELVNRVNNILITIPSAKVLGGITSLCKDGLYYTAQSMTKS